MCLVCIYDHVRIGNDALFKGKIMLWFINRILFKKKKLMRNGKPMVRIIHIRCFVLWERVLWQPLENEKKFFFFK